MWVIPDRRIETAVIAVPGPQQHQGES